MKKLIEEQQPVDRQPVDPDRAWISIERTYRVAVYESLKVSLGVSVSTYPGETVRGALHRAFGELKPEFDDVAGLLRVEHGV